MEIDWSQDYNNEFICPKCELGWLNLYARAKTIIFRCGSCLRKTNNLCQVKKCQPYIDLDTNTTWFHGQRVDDFICPECGVQHIVFDRSRLGKKHFFCKNCQKTTLDSINLSRIIVSRYSQQKMSVKRFTFEDDIWDLRAIHSLIDEQNYKYIIYFQSIKSQWFKSLVKRYIHHLCKLDTPLNTIDQHMTSFRFLSRYLVEMDISSINQINRSVILDFISHQSTEDAVKSRLWTLRDFFTIGQLLHWFNIDQDLVRDDDYPKVKLRNPDPLIDIVREQIEKKLHLLPDPIARMWIIAFFTAMRSSELALLKKDCLVQSGANWKIIWNRKKGKDQHEVPITRIIAKVIQEQQEYINSLWGEDWNYLFCHYQGISRTDLTQPNIKPVKKVIPVVDSPLQIAIRCLIKVENIRDLNGELATFSPRLIRPTRLTQLFEQGHDLAVVSAWAGHKLLSTTSLHYTKVSCELIGKEAGHIQKALLNIDGKPLHYESMPKSFWQNPRAHELNIPSDHINTPIYGYCGLPLDEDCNKFRACLTCGCFAAIPEKLPLYIKNRDELRAKESRARVNGHDVLVEQFSRQADQLDKIIASLTGGGE
ncbi:tyrosine-type recombinase/integrase [Iningainema tapete]|nr:site-specific integrase [Iningainema tapete]